MYCILLSIYINIHIILDTHKDVLLSFFAAQPNVVRMWCMREGRMITTSSPAGGTPARGRRRTNHISQLSQLDLPLCVAT